MMVRTVRFVVGEIGLRDPLHVGRRDVLEDVELAVRRLDVVVDDGGVRELQRLLLVRLPAEDVVARELVLGALQFVFGDAAQPSGLSSSPISALIASSGDCPGCTIATA